MHGKVLEHISTGRFDVTLHDGRGFYKRIVIKERYSKNPIVISDQDDWDELVLAMAKLLPLVKD